MKRKNKNVPEVKFFASFNKQLQNAPEEIQEVFFDTLELFLEDPDNPLLRNHELHRKFAGYRSINITGDWRAIFKEVNRGKQNIIKFYLIGTHTDLYKK